jgi:hypothetical protein
MGTPSRNPLMADHNSTQQMRTDPYNMDRSSRTQRKRTNKVDPSAYEISIFKSRRMLILSILFIHPLSTFSSTLCRRCDGRWSDYPNVCNMLPIWTAASATSASESAESPLTAYMESLRIQTRMHKNVGAISWNWMEIIDDNILLLKFCRAC